MVWRAVGVSGGERWKLEVLCSIPQVYLPALTHLRVHGTRGKVQTVQTRFSSNLPKDVQI